MFIPAPAVADFILEIHTVSSSGSTAKASTNGMPGAYSFTKFAMLPISELCITMSAAVPVPAIVVPLLTTFKNFVPFLPKPATLAAFAIRVPNLAAPIVLPPIPPVTADKRPNSTRPLASLPYPELFSGTF